MKSLTLSMTVWMTLLCGLPAAQAADVGPIVETFACNFADGKGADDLTQAVSFWNAQIDKIASADLDTYTAGILTPLRANTELDFVWLGGYPSLEAWGAGTASYTGSREGQAADAKFAGLRSCTSNTYVSTPLLNTLAPPAVGDSAVIETFTCTLQDGKTMDDAAEVENHWKASVTSVDPKISAFRLTPFYATIDGDFHYLVVNDDLASFAAFHNAWDTSDQGQESSRRFGAVMTCDSALFTGDPIRVAAPPE